MHFILERINHLCEDYHVKTFYVFGSRASEVMELLEGARKSLSYGRSDLDVAVLVSYTLSINEKVDITAQLEVIFNIPRVDLVILNDADPFVAANAIRGNRLFASNSYEADEYELFVLRRAGDLAGFERERISMVLRDP